MSPVTPLEFRGATLLHCNMCVCRCGRFFLAARQHFNTIDFGFKNGRLRKQVDDLQTERRRLLLAREVSMSPAELKRLQELGIRDRGEVATIAAKASTPVFSATAAVRTGDTVSIPSIGSDAPKAVKAFYPEPTKADRADTPVKKIVMQKARKIDEGRLVASVR